MMQQTKKLVVFFIALSLLGLSQTEAKRPYIVTLRVNSLEAAKQLADAEHLDVVGVSEANSELSLLTFAEPRTLLKSLELQLNDGQLQLELKSWQKSRPYRELRNANDGPGYWDYDETVAQLESLAAANSSIASVIDLEELFGIKTHEGRNLKALQISLNPGVVEDEPKALFIGQHHARELMTHHTVVDLAKALIADYVAAKPDAVKAVQQSSLWFVPVVNPDGLEYVFDVERMWRKNRSANSDGSRGVDLNRNYSFKWGECGSNSANPSSDIFKGASPESEAEVKIMDKLNSVLRAQYVISFHSAGNEVLYPYKCGELAERALYHDVRDRLAEALAFGKRYASSSGEDFEHHYAKYGSLSFLLEIGQSFQPDFAVYQNTVWPKVKKVLPFIIEEMQSPFVNIKVKDANTGAAVTANLQINGINFTEGEIRTTDQFGSYRWLLPDGNYQLRVAASGYRAQTVSLSNNGAVSKVEISLETL